MSQAHTRIILRDLFMVNDTKITREAEAFLESCEMVSGTRYSLFNVAHVYGVLLQFGRGDSLFKTGEADTSCIEFSAPDCSMTKLDEAHELLLGFLIALDHAHPAVTLSVTTSAPREFLFNVFKIARAFSPDLPRPAWLPERDDIALDYASLPSDLDFRA